MAVGRSKPEYQVESWWKEAQATPLPGDKVSVEKAFVSATLKAIGMKTDEANPGRQDGFDLEGYLSLLPFTKILLKHEGDMGNPEQEARNYAAKLIMLFGNAPSAAEYLVRNERQTLNNQKAGSGGKLLHDACSFSLPTASDWDAKLWQKIVNRYKPSTPNDLVIRIVALAPNVQKYVNENETAIKEEIAKSVRKEFEGSGKSENFIKGIIKTRCKDLLSSMTPMSQLEGYIERCAYQNAGSNPEAAKVFFERMMTEDEFNKYLSLVPQDDPSKIPDILIPGSEISEAYRGYYIKKLDSHDPRAAILGKDTSCCQRLGEAGEAPTIYGITSPNAGFYVLCKKLDDKEDVILSQCMVFRSGNEMVFDSIESQVNFRGKHSTLITDCFIYLANYLVEKYKVDRVNVGVGPAAETPKTLRAALIFSPVKPVDYTGYCDSAFQCMLADKSIGRVIFDIYQAEDPSTKLSDNNASLSFLPDKMTREDAIACCDILGYRQRFINDSKDSTPINFEKLIQMSGVTREALEERVKEQTAWFDFIISLQNPGMDEKALIEKLNYFLRKGFSVNTPIPDSQFVEKAIVGEVEEERHENGGQENENDDESYVSYDYPINFAVEGKYPALVECLVEAGSIIDDNELYFNILELSQSSENMNLATKLLKSLDIDDENTLWRFCEILSEDFFLIEKIISIRPELLVKFSTSVIFYDVFQISVRDYAINNEIEKIKKIASIGLNFDYVEDNVHKSGNDIFIMAAAQAPKVFLTITKYYKEIDPNDKENCHAIFSSLISKIIWKNYQYDLYDLASFRDALKYLISKGVDINHHISIEASSDHSCHPSIKGRFSSDEVIHTYHPVEFLLTRDRFDLRFFEIAMVFVELGKVGPDDFKRPRDNQSLLHLAVEYGDIDAIQRLIKQGASLDSVDCFGRTPLFFVAHMRSSDELKKAAIQVLVKAGADINAKTQHGYTTLSNYNCNYEMTRFLVEGMGADVNVKNGKGETVLDDILSMFIYNSYLQADPNVIAFYLKKGVEFDFMPIIMVQEKIVTALLSTQDFDAVKIYLSHLKSFCEKTGYSIIGMPQIIEEIQKTGRPGLISLVNAINSVRAPARLSTSSITLHPPTKRNKQDIPEQEPKSESLPTSPKGHEKK